MYFIYSIMDITNSLDVAKDTQHELPIYFYSWSGGGQMGRREKQNIKPWSFILRDLGPPYTKDMLWWKWKSNLNSFTQECPIQVFPSWKACEAGYLQGRWAPGSRVGVHQHLGARTGGRGTQGLLFQRPAGGPWYSWDFTETAATHME